MKKPIKFSLTRAFVITAICSIALGLLVGICNYMERERWRVYSSEQVAADAIFNRLGGSYTTELRKKDKRILAVNLRNTKTTDEDLRLIMKLSKLQFLDVRNTQVSDSSLELIFSHKKLIELKQRDSAITEGLLEAFWYKSSMRLSVDWSSKHQ